MTTAKEAGLVIGGTYELLDSNTEGWPAGTQVVFLEDDDSICPKFAVPRDLDGSGRRFIFVSELNPTPVSQQAAKEAEFSVAVTDRRTTFQFDRKLSTAEVAAVLKLVNN